MFNLMSLKRLGRYAASMRIAITNQEKMLELGFQTGDPRRPMQTSGHVMPAFTYTSDSIAAGSSTTDQDAARFVQSDASGRVADEALSAFALHNVRVATAMADPTLSPSGKQQSWLASTTTIVTTLGELYASLMRIGERLQADHDALYGPPPNDAVSVAIDIEVRAQFRALPPADQMQWLAAPALPLLLALRRSPFKLPVEHAKAVTESWVAHIAREKPEAAQKLEIAMSTHEWASGLLRWLAALIVKPGTMERWDAYRILLPTGGAAVLSFTPQEIVFFSKERVVLSRTPAIA